MFVKSLILRLWSFNVQFVERKKQQSFVKNNICFYYPKCLYLTQNVHHSKEVFHDQ